MELSSVLMGLTTVILIVVPIYIISLNGNKKKKEQLKQYRLLGEQHGLTITESDAWNGIFIGIDANSRKVLFVKNRDGNEQSILVNLTEVAGCKKVNVSRNVKINSATNNVIDQLGLEMTLKNGLPALMLEFYNSKYSFLLQNELLLMEKWAKLINAQLQPLKVAA